MYNHPYIIILSIEAHIRRRAPLDSASDDHRQREHFRFHKGHRDLVEVKAANGRRIRRDNLCDSTKGRGEGDAVADGIVAVGGVGTLRDDEVV